MLLLLLLDTAHSAVGRNDRSTFAASWVNRSDLYRIHLARAIAVDQSMTQQRNQRATHDASKRH